MTFLMVKGALGALSVFTFFFSGVCFLPIMFDLVKNGRPYYYRKIFYVMATLLVFVVVINCYAATISQTWVSFGYLFFFFIAGCFVGAIAIATEASQDEKAEMKAVLNKLLRILRRKEAG